MIFSAVDAGDLIGSLDKLVAVPTCYLICVAVGGWRLLFRFIDLT